MPTKFLLLLALAAIVYGLYTLDLFSKRTLKSEDSFLEKPTIRDEPTQSTIVNLLDEKEGSFKLKELNPEDSVNDSIEDIEQYFETSRETLRKQSHNKELNFIAMGDFGYVDKDKPDPEQKKLGEFIANRVRKSFVDFDFMLSVGDNFYPLGLESPIDKKADVLFEDTFQMSSLGLDWYSALGNHDLIGDMEAALRLHERFPYWKQTERYYYETFNIGDSELKAAFVFVHSPDIVCRTKTSFECYKNIQKNIKFDEIDTQIEWLDDTLAMLSADPEIIWKIVIIHNAVFSAGKKHGDNQDIKETVLPLLTKYKVDVILSGHDHSVQYLRMDTSNQAENERKEEQNRDKCPNEPDYEYCSEKEFFYFNMNKCGEIIEPENHNYLGSVYYKNRPNLLGFFKSKYIRYSTAMQHEYMHQFILGNGGIKHEELCPVKQMESEGKLRYGHSVSGIGEIKATEKRLDVNLVSVEGDLLYSLSIFRNNVNNVYSNF